MEFKLFKYSKFNLANQSFIYIIILFNNVFFISQILYGKIAEKILLQIEQRIIHLYLIDYFATFLQIL